MHGGKAAERPSPGPASISACGRAVGRSFTSEWCAPPGPAADRPLTFLAGRPLSLGPIHRKHIFMELRSWSGREAIFLQAAPFP